MGEGALLHNGVSGGSALRCECPPIDEGRGDLHGNGRGSGSGSEVFLLVHSSADESCRCDCCVKSVVRTDVRKYFVSGY